MKTVTVRQIQKLDKLAIKKYGVPSLCLMENAGRSVADEVLRMTKKIKNPKVYIVCGLGNNAGDGFVVARHLINASVKVEVVLVGDFKKLKTDALVNYKILKKIRFPMKQVRRVTSVFKRNLKIADLVVDGIFGVGLNRTISGVFYDVIGAINENAKKILSIDVPSGLDATTGLIYGACINAHTTVTMTFAKRGFIKCLGPKVCGKINVVDIGIPLMLIKKV